MAIHRGPGRRTPRTRAVEIGTIPAGFAGAIDYDVPGGHPLDTGIPKGRYREQPPMIVDGRATANQPKPIK